MTSAKSTVHQLLVDDTAMELMIRAIAKLSWRNRRFETLRDVVLHVIESRPVLAPDMIEGFFDLIPLDGQNRVFLRINQEHTAAFEAFKDELCALTQRNCAMREVVCFCCLLVVSDRF